MANGTVRMAAAMFRSIVRTSPVWSRSVEAFADYSHDQKMGSGSQPLWQIVELSCWLSPRPTKKAIHKQKTQVILLKAPPHNRYVWLYGKHSSLDI